MRSPARKTVLSNPIAASRRLRIDPRGFCLALQLTCMAWAKVGSSSRARSSCDTISLSRRARRTTVTSSNNTTAIANAKTATATSKSFICVGSACENVRVKLQTRNCKASTVGGPNTGGSERAHHPAIRVDTCSDKLEQVLHHHGLALHPRYLGDFKDFTAAVR